jgi:hypothetical protein
VDPVPDPDELGPLDLSLGTLTTTQQRRSTSNYTLHKYRKENLKGSDDGNTQNPNYFRDKNHGSFLI